MFRKPRITSILAGVVALGIVLFVVASYVAFTDYRKNMAEHGAWYVNFQTRIDPEVGTLQIKDAGIQVDYERNVGYLSYQDWFFGQFHSSDSSEQRENATIFTVHVKVDTVIKEKTRNVLFNEKYAVDLDDLTSGNPFVLNKTFGPYIAYNSTLPLKVSYVVEIIDYLGVVQTSTGAYYVTAWK